MRCYFIMPAAATETGAKFVELRASEVVRGAIGESEKAVERAFKAARELAPAIIFIDEFQVRH
jgi:SpoVK/Ycf46/Vps4 family AAA+-type ATPase